MTHNQNLTCKGDASAHRDLGVHPSRFERWVNRRKRASQHEKILQISAEYTVLFEIMRPLAIFLTILFSPSIGSVFLLTTPTCWISMNSEFKAEFVDTVLFLCNRLLKI